MKRMIIRVTCPMCGESYFINKAESHSSCPFCEETEEEEDVNACMRESLEFTGQWW